VFVKIIKAELEAVDGRAVGLNLGPVTPPAVILMARLQGRVRRPRSPSWPSTCRERQLRRKVMVVSATSIVAEAIKQFWEPWPSKWTSPSSVRRSKSG